MKALGWLGRNAASLTLFLATIVFVLCLRANAATEMEEDGSIKIKTTGSMVAPREISGSGGKVGESRAEIEAAWSIGRITLTGQYEGRFYAWEDPGRLPFGNGSAPWSNLHRLGADVSYRGDLWGDFGYFVGGYAGASFEDSLDDALNLIGYGGATWRISNEWTASVGAGVTYNRVETFPFPVVGLHYVSSSIKGLTAELKFPFASAAWRFSDMFGVRVFGNYDYGIYKLRRDSPVVRGGFVETRGYVAGAYLDMWPAKRVRLSVGAEYDFQGDYSLYRDDGSRIRRYTRDGGPGGRAQFKWTF